MPNFTVERRRVRVSDPPPATIEEARAQLDALVEQHRAEHHCDGDALAHVLASAIGRRAMKRVRGRNARTYQVKE